MSGIMGDGAASVNFPGIALAISATGSDSRPASPLAASPRHVAAGLRLVELHPVGGLRLAMTGPSTLQAPANLRQSPRAL
jgi:hypothetical protein